MRRTLLLTGFEPFGGDRFNPSGEIARAVDGIALPGGATICSLILPVSGPSAWQKLSRAIRRIEPRWIIATGVSGRSEISVESTAWNEDDYRIPDNSGHQPRSTPILSRGPAKLATGLTPQPPLTENLCRTLPIRPSTDPGRYVCNHLYYRLLHLTKSPAHLSHGRALFLHLPCTMEMRRGPDDTRFFHPLEDLRELVLGMLGGIAKEQSTRWTAAISSASAPLR